MFKKLERSRRQVLRYYALKFAQKSPAFDHKCTKMVSLRRNYTPMDSFWRANGFILLKMYAIPYRLAGKS